MDGNNEQHKPGDRIAKVIARAGLASRREAETWIAAGRVAVNGAVIDSPACNVSDADRVTVDGEPLPARERTRLFLYHKPRGLMTTHADPQGRPTLFQRLPKDLPRLISIGRLDFNTEGLLLLTNDGALARALELPSTGWLRRYRVRAHGAVTQKDLDALRHGVTISGIHYGAIDAAIERVQGSNLWLTFAIREGKNREVRNVLGHLGLDVTRLIRVSYGPFQLSELAEGAVEEVRTRTLREQLGVRLTADAGVDFSGPVAPRPRVEKRVEKRAERRVEKRIDKKDARRETAPQKAPSKKTPSKTPHHSWRAHEEDRPGKKLQRKFHGARRDGAAPREAVPADARKGVLTDRKGRSVKVERHGEPPVREVPQDKREHRGRNKYGKSPSRGRRSADRASGPRPRHPRGR
jgi:23S rRNA pseudouridine2605 synthase